MASPYWVRKLINRTFTQRFRLSRLTKVAGVGRLIEWALFEDDEIMFLPRDHVIPIDQTLANPDSIVIPSQVVDHFIRSTNHIWRMDFCICRESSGCQEYPLDLGCLFLGQAAMDINPRFGRRVSRDEALKHAARCREAGLVHLIGRNKLDTVWLNVGPKERLLTLCNCCPCCCLWRILPELAPRIETKITRMPGLQITITDRCQGCGVCTQAVCFVDAIHLNGGHAEIEDRCRGCGRCVTICPNGAIELTLADNAFVQTAIERIASVVDLT
jgi:Pyruvate/2-oxoacid:ferredoxin oxidoreductase delta subunit